VLDDAALGSGEISGDERDIAKESGAPTGSFDVRKVDSAWKSGWSSFWVGSR